MRAVSVVEVGCLAVAKSIPHFTVAGNIENRPTPKKNLDGEPSPELQLQSSFGNQHQVAHSKVPVVSVEKLLEREQQQCSARSGGGGGTLEPPPMRSALGSLG